MGPMLDCRLPPGRARCRCSRSKTEPPRRFPVPPGGPVHDPAEPGGRPNMTDTDFDFDFDVDRERGRLRGTRADDDLGDRHRRATANGSNGSARNGGQAARNGCRSRRSAYGDGSRAGLRAPADGNGRHFSPHPRGPQAWSPDERQLLPQLRAVVRRRLGDDDWLRRATRTSAATGSTRSRRQTTAPPAPRSRRGPQACAKRPPPRHRARAGREASSGRSHRRQSRRTATSSPCSSASPRRAEPRSAAQPSSMRLRGAARRRSRAPAGRPPQARREPGPLRDRSTCRARRVAGRGARDGNGSRPPRGAPTLPKRIGSRRPRKPKPGRDQEVAPGGHPRRPRRCWRWSRRSSG